MTLGSFDNMSVGLGSVEDRMIDLFHSTAFLLKCAPEIVLSWKMIFSCSIK